MILMDIKLDNIFAFRNFHANFSYPKKIVGTNIEGEYLSGLPKFNYKKVNILMGANATGKTTLGNALIAIFNFIQRKNPTYLIDATQFRNGKGFASLDFVVEDSESIYRLYRVLISIEENKNGTEPILQVAMNFVSIRKNEIYAACAKRLDQKEFHFSKDFISMFDQIPLIGWYFSDVNTKYLDKKNRKGDRTFIKVLDLVLKAFDSFITDVKPIDDDKDSILIKFNNGDSVIYHNGESTKKLLSTGTESAITIAEIITNVMLKRNGFYYLDEKFCFVQSDLEKSILTVLIDLLGDDQQLFFTTHNTDILDLDLPKHTFSFFKKDKNDLNAPIKLISASDFLKKQTDSLRNAVENDLFATAPDDTNIYKILDIKESVE